MGTATIRKGTGCRRRRLCRGLSRTRGRPVTSSGPCRSFCPPRLTLTPHRALRTPRRPRHAHQRSQLHHRLIESPSSLPILGYDLRGEVPDVPVPRPPSPVPNKDSRDHPLHVRIHRRHRLLVSEAGHGSGSVSPDSRKVIEVFRVVRQLAVHRLADHARKRVEIRSPGIVSQSIPSLSHRLRARARESFYRREPLQESRIELRDSTHLCLLQHELRHDDAVRIAGAAPGEVARMLSIPPKQLARKGLSGLGRHRYITYYIP